jgi:hypothetical protein
VKKSYSLIFRFTTLQIDFEIQNLAMRFETFITTCSGIENVEN